MEINIDQYKMETMIRLIIYIISRIILFMIHYSFYSWKFGTISEKRTAVVVHASFLNIK